VCRIQAADELIQDNKWREYFYSVTNNKFSDENKQKQTHFSFKFVWINNFIANPANKTTA
jgi:hypothetical protein